MKPAIDIEAKSGEIRIGRAVLALAVSVIAIGGCASLEPKPGFGDVQGLLRPRISASVSWRDTPEEDAAAAQTVRALLGRPLEADSAVHVALLNNPELQASYQQLGIAAADLMQAGLIANPLLSVQVRNSAGGTQREFGVTQDFLSVLTLAPRRQLAEGELQKARLETAQRVLELAVEVKAQYYTVAGDAQSLALFRRAGTATQAAAERAHRQRQAGNLSARDQAAQQVFYAQTLLEVARLEAQLAGDREKLNRLMGLWGSQTQWRVEALPEVPDLLPDGEALEARAVANRLDLSAAKQTVANLQSAHDNANRYRLLGALGVGYGYERGSDGEKLKGPNIELGLPLFDRNQANLARLKVQLRQSERRLESLAIRIRSEVREAYDRLVAQRDMVAHYRKAVLPLHEIVVKETLKFYNGMLLGTYDLLTASQNQLLAERDYILAVRDFWRARAALEGALGGAIDASAAPAQPAPAAAPGTDSSHHH